MAEQEEPLLNGGELNPGKAEEPPADWYAEGWDVCKLAGPACLQLFFQYIVIVTNQSFAGHIGGNELAAAAIAVTAFNFLWYFLLGLSSAQDTLGSQAFGANNRARVISWAVTTAFCMSVLAVPMAVVLYFGDFLAVYIFQQPQEVADLVAVYCQGMIPGLLPLVWSIVIMKAMQAQNIMWGPTWMTAGMAVANLALNVAGSRLYGFWGVAYAQSAGRVVQFLLLALYVFLVDSDCLAYDRPCFAPAEATLSDGEDSLAQPLAQSMELSGAGGPKDEAAPKRMSHGEVIAQGFSLKRMGIFLKLGLPGGLMMAADASAFDITTAMAGFLGTVEVGAHTALLTLCVLIYMAVPFGIATAATIRVGNMLGAGKPAAARRTAWLTMGLCAFYSALATVLIAGFHSRVGLIFTTAPQVVALVSKIAFLAAIYQLPDAVYGVFSGVLRGMGRQAQLVGCNIIGFWLVGTATGYTLAFRFHLGVSGLWLGINAGVFTCAIYSSTLLYLVNWRAESAKAQALVAKADAEAAAAAAAALAAAAGPADEESPPSAAPATPASVVATSAAGRPIARPISLEGRPSLQGSLGGEAPVVGSLSSALTGSYIQRMTNRDFASGSFRRV